MTTRGERNIAWIETFCRIPAGRDVGQAVVLRPWQQDVIKAIYDNPHGTRRAIISFGRKNAKTTLAAFLNLLHLCGPEAFPNSELYSAAQSRDQAALLFSQAAKCVRLSPELSEIVVPRDTAKQLYCKPLGTVYKALSAEATTAYGLNPALIVHDELGQVRGPRSELYEALETATGAQENPLSIIISTQAPGDNDLLSILIDDAKTGRDPRVVLCLYETPEDVDDMYCEESIRMANPALGDFLNLDEVMAMAADARDMQSRRPEYQNLILNQRIEMNQPYISKSVWQGCKAELSPIGENPVYGGLDLSEVNDLTAKVYVSQTSQGHAEIHPTFWLPFEGLRARSKKDRVPYDVWAASGALTTTPGPTIDYEYVAHSLYEDCKTMNVQKIAFDRYNWKHLRPWLLRAGFLEFEVDEIFVPFNQSSVSMSPALRELESMLLEKKLLHASHPVMNMCIANAIVEPGPTGLKRFTKSKSTGRIDGAVALAMAVSMFATEQSNHHTEAFVEL